LSPWSDKECVSYPTYPPKHRHEALFGPDDDPLTSVDDTSVPPAAILTYQTDLFESIVADRAAPESGLSPIYDHHVLPETDGEVGIVGDFGIGAPAAALTVESLLAAGVERFVSVGWAGSLWSPSRLAVGDVVVPDRALRDEGTSYHYLDATTWAVPDADLADAVRTAAAAHGSVHVGGTWTVDAPYRETAQEAARYRDRGVLTVEMEAAAVFAVATHRDVDAAAAFVVSDYLDAEWDPQFERAADHHDRLVEVGIDALVT
jgi:uridine phosphorylase